MINANQGKYFKTFGKRTVDERYYENEKTKEKEN